MAKTPDLWSEEMASYVRLAVAEAVARGEVLFDAESYGEIAEANADHAYRLRATLMVRCIMEKASDPQASAVIILDQGTALMREALLVWLGENELPAPGSVGYDQAT